MKKKLIVAALAIMASSAFALDVGVTAGEQFAGSDLTVGGVTVGQKLGKVGVTGGFERMLKNGNDQNRWSLVGSYDVVKFGPVDVAAKAGVSYLNNQKTSDGFAGLVGVGATLPVAKNWAVTADYRYQFGQKRVTQFDGGNAALGLRYTF